MLLSSSVMDELMWEATDLILSSGHDVTTGPDKMLRWESRKNLADVSSVTLLRLSITNSLKDRSTQSEVADIEPSKQNKKSRRRGSSTRKPKVDIQLLNPEEDNLYVKVSDFSDKESNNQNCDAKEQNQRDDSENASLPEPLSYVEDLETLGQSWEFETQKTEAGDDKNDVVDGIVADDKEQATRNKIVENGLKLARRKFSDGIFENCSTYSLTCPEVLQERDYNTVPSNQDPPAESKPFSVSESTIAFVDKPPRVNSEEDAYISDYNTSASVNDSDNRADDQISLSDSFFVSVTSDDYVPQKSIFSKESEYSIGSKKSSRSPLSVQNDFPVSEDATHDSGVRFHQRSERKLSKRLRKRRKKSSSKAKDVPTYECLKCGISYILSTNASDSTACCLHCDFWTSVEPVFLKREKQPWNTCRIC